MVMEMSWIHSLVSTLSWNTETQMTEDSTPELMVTSPAQVHLSLHFSFRANYGDAALTAVFTFHHAKYGHLAPVLSRFVKIPPPGCQPCSKSLHSQDFPLLKFAEHI